MPRSGRLWPIEVGNISIAPILHNCLEFCWPVRELVTGISPGVIALELPAGLESIWLRAVSRFPKLSLIASSEVAEKQQASALWQIEPTDPFCEAIRSALELEISISFVDDLELGYPAYIDRLPDPYSITALGPSAYLKACFEVFEIESKKSRDYDEPLDLKRELHMASRLQALAKDRRVLFLCGIKHARGIATLLESPAPEEVPNPPPLELKLYHPSLRSVRTLSGEMPFLMTLYELQRGGPGEPNTWLTKRDDDNLVGALSSESSAGPASVSPLDKRSVFSSLEKLLGMKAGSVSDKDLSPSQLKQMLSYLRTLKPESWSPSFLDSDIVTPGQEPDGPRDNSPDQLGFFTFRDVSSRRGELLNDYGKLNLKVRSSSGAIDRQLAYRGLVELAAKFYSDNTGEIVKEWQHLNLAHFARRYAALKYRLLPSTLGLVYSARACVDHNFAYEFWDLATFYPWQDESSGDASLFDFDGENLQIDGMKVRHFQFQRTFPRLRPTMGKLPLEKRSRPADDPSKWAEAFEDSHICSYPPEDVVIEDYGRYLQKKAIKVQSDAHSRSEPFTTTLLDGIDMRTTMRNWADGQKIYVREERKISGGTGAVVLIFASESEEAKYPWGITWHGEHDQEADMAFYATDRKSKIVGPGIARCEYGGLMLSYPSRRLGSVWGDPTYRIAKTKAEVLLMASIDYCLDKHVLYVAAKAPRSYFFSLAQRLGKKLVYLPIGTLSPTSIERIRVFHVLAGHSYRDIAKNFIW